jgi:hydroxymethylpyrimidine kinase/phosphomethylpyrimidine kinase/thiamine-phosphate diphosphorylase
MPEGPGIYAIVDTAERLARCAEHGAQIVQLRTKLPAHPTPKDQAALRQAIATSIAAAHAAGACLFINDHRQAALDLGASGLHLGQEDLLALTEMQRTALRQPRQHAEGGRLLAVDWAREDGKAGKAGQDGKGSEGGLQLLRLGISSHSVWELARARALAPDYIACGPVWATTTKDMPWRPQGLRNLRWWVANAGCRHRRHPRCRAHPRHRRLRRGRRVRGAWPGRRSRADPAGPAAGAGRGPCACAAARAGAAASLAALGLRGARCAD